MKYSIYNALILFSIAIPTEIPDPCHPSPCGSNAVCKERNGAGSCQCLPEYSGDPYTGCRPECVLNSECSHDKACVNNKCVNPCIGVCGSNAECRVINHAPSCSCVIGYTGNPLVACHPTPKPPPRKILLLSYCILYLSYVYVLLFFSLLLLLLLWVNDTFTELSYSSLSAYVLRILSIEIIGTKFLFFLYMCTILRGCKSVTHSRLYNLFISTHVLHARGYMCSLLLLYTLARPERPRNPCIPSPCGPYSECRQVDNHAVCSCQKNYIGSPPACRPECMVSSECPQNKACIKQKCQDPCVGTCGYNARCQVVSHNPICSCSPGFTGDPFVRCVKEERKQFMHFIRGGGCSLQGTICTILHLKQYIQSTGFDLHLLIYLLPIYLYCVFISSSLSIQFFL